MEIKILKRISFSTSNDPTEAPRKSIWHKRKMERAQGEKRKGARRTMSGARGKLKEEEKCKGIRGK